MKGSWLDKTGNGSAPEHLPECGAVHDVWKERRPRQPQVRDDAKAFRFCGKTGKAIPSPGA
jgi:hypothetical protein